ncbi:hypothetical protein SK128_019227 [Halocaridina rubra]|uniref:Uncharacterized protein n=1 Tax=Halocaridina rubra TaxID=373956 RepID=A0AAN8X3P5_HALRR
MNSTVSSHWEVSRVLVGSLNSREVGNILGLKIMNKTLYLLFSVTSEIEDQRGHQDSSHNMEEDHVQLKRQQAVQQIIPSGTKIKLLFSWLRKHCADFFQGGTEIKWLIQMIFSPDINEDME